MIYQAIAALALAAVIGTAAYFTGRMHENEGWATVVAEQDAKINAYELEAKDRAKRDRELATKTRAKHKAEAAAKEKERAQWIADARAAWAAELDGLRVADASDSGRDPVAALSTCRAANDATRAGLEQLLTAADQARAACDRDRTQLGSLLTWLNGVTRK